VRISDGWVMDWTEQELIDLYEERAAIREYDGGMTRKDAERAAYFDWRVIVGRGVAAPKWIVERAKLIRSESCEEI